MDIKLPGNNGKSGATLYSDVSVLVNGRSVVLNLAFFFSDLHGLPWEDITHKGVVSRSSCWLVQPGCCCPYKYGGKSWKPASWPKWIEQTARALEHKLKLPFSFLNSCNCNKYAGPKEALGYHSDDEPMFRQSEFERDVYIVSVSFGQSRAFSIRRKYGETLGPIELVDGSILTMHGRMQDDYQHAVLPSSSDTCTIRFNLTFRAVLRHVKKCQFCRQSKS